MELINWLNLIGQKANCLCLLAPFEASFDFLEHINFPPLYLLYRSIKPT